MNQTSYFSPTISMTTTISGAIEGSIGLILNLSSILLLVRSKKLRKNAISPLICALALSDLMFCLSLIFAIHQFYNNEPYPEGSFLCYFAPISYR